MRTLEVPTSRLAIKAVDSNSRYNIEPPMDHIALDQLEHYSRNKIPPEKLASIEEHLLLCEPCRMALEKLEAEARVMRHALAHYAKPPRE